MSEDDPNDIHFAYAGYAPLSVRIVQQVRALCAPAPLSSPAAFGRRAFTAAGPRRRGCTPTSIWECSCAFCRSRCARRCELC